MSTPRRILAALAVAGLTLAAASPAGAIYRSYEPADADAPTIERTMAQDDTSPKKGCTLDVKTPDGKTQSSITYAHGYSFSTVNKATGKTHTFTCNNGTWEETVSASSPTSGWHYDAEYSYVESADTNLAVGDYGYLSEAP